MQRLDDIAVDYHHVNMRTIIHHKLFAVRGMSYFFAPPSSPLKERTLLLPISTPMNASAPTLSLRTPLTTSFFPVVHIAFTSFSRRSTVHKSVPHSHLCPPLSPPPPPSRGPPILSKASIITTEFPRITHMPSRTFSLLGFDSVASSSTMLRKTYGSFCLVMGAED